VIRIEHTTDIATSTARAYEQWLRYESYPLFMEHVKEVSETADGRLHWRGLRYHREVEWDSEIISKVPQRTLAWRDFIEGSYESTTVSIHEVDSTHCRVQMIIQVDLHESVQDIATAEHEMIERVETDLARFKALVEHSEAKPFDSDSPALSGVEYAHHSHKLNNGLLTDTPGSPQVPTPRDMSRNPHADGLDNRIDPPAAK
jgi:uncharacterized membrane protein